MTNRDKRSGRDAPRREQARIISVGVEDSDGTQHEIGSTEITSGRRCGSCTLCCKLVPVEGLGKPAGRPCQFQRYGKGRTVHHQPERGFPIECALWNCKWLTGEIDGGRPDRAHFVVDPLPDFIYASDPATGERHKLSAAQVWCDPQFPDAWRTPTLLAYIEKLGKSGFPTMIRYSNLDGFPVIPPAMNNGEWLERHDSRAGPESDVVERFAAAGALAKAGARE